MFPSLLKAIIIVYVLNAYLFSLPQHHKKNLAAHIVESVYSNGDTLHYLYTKNDLSAIDQRGSKISRYTYLYDQSHKIIEEKIFDSIQAKTPYQRIKIDYNKKGMIDKIVMHTNDADSLEGDVIFQFEYKDSVIYKLTMGLRNNNELNNFVEYVFEVCNGNIEKMIMNNLVLHEKEIIHLTYNNFPNYFQNLFTQPILQASIEFPIDGFLITKMLSKCNPVTAKFDNTDEEYSYKYLLDQSKKSLMVQKLSNDYLLSEETYIYGQTTIE